MEILATLGLALVAILFFGLLYFILWKNFESKLPYTEKEAAAIIEAAKKKEVEQALKNQEEAEAFMKKVAEMKDWVRLGELVKVDELIQEMPKGTELEEEIKVRLRSFIDAHIEFNLALKGFKRVVN